MNKLLIIISLLLVNPGAVPSFGDKNQENAECLKKSSSEWGSKCGSCYNSSKSYRINLKNVCEVNIDVKVAVQEKTSRWRTFSQNNLAPGDTISAYACEGTGKYVFWSKHAGDKTVVFPTDEEIEIEFAQGKK